MLSWFVAIGLLDENRTLRIELPDENIAGLLELKIKPDEKYDQIFGIELRYSNSTAGALEHLDACESVRKVF
ncbi:hypothetical protein C1646_770631 [Rhizophagus diaphanus]|nr:hypothetical protein C1646_770631 [Rhizophagus diaphanus] [Rhizophagus sp. MUCL 43196]